jgi:lysophospholipase L1-like esterase
MTSAYPPRRPRTRLTLIAVVALAAGACGDPWPSNPAVAVVVGDSLLFQSTHDVERALESKGWLPVVDGRPGSTITGGSSIDRWDDRITDLVRAVDPDVVVVELGTNGCGDCGSIRGRIDSVMRRLTSVERVYWVNVKEQSPIPPDPVAMNEAIEAATGRWNNLDVIDMNERFANRPALLQADQIHFSVAGQRVFADLIADAVPDAD